MILNVRPALWLLFNHSRVIWNSILKKGMFPVKKIQNPSPTELTWRTFLLEPDKLITYFLSHTNCRAIKIWDISWKLGYWACVFSADCRHTPCPCTCVKLPNPSLVKEMVLGGEGRGRKVKSECYITKLKYPWVILFLPPFHLTFIFIRKMALNSD